MDENDDDALWRQLIATVKPLRLRNALHQRRPARPARMKRESSRIDPAPDLPRLAVTPSPVPPRQAKKLSQQKIPVERYIDLHGMTVDRAHNAVLRFLADAWRSEVRCVEIVTGRGDPHRGTGQLRRLVPFWLNEPQTRPLILHIAPNPASRGGSLLVLLRRNRAGD